MRGRPLSDDEKRKMREGRAAARERKKAAAAAKTAAEPAPVAMPPLNARVERVREAAAPYPDSVVDAKLAEMEVTEVDEGELPADDFEKFLALQDAETRSVLSDVELRIIYETETKRAAEERKEAAKKAVKARALRHARLNAGLMTPEAIEAAGLRDRLSRKVTWTVEMPEAGRTGRLIDAGYRIDGKLLYHGQEVTGTLAEYISYRSMWWNAHQAELDFQGVGRLSRLRRSLVPDANLVQIA